MIEVRPKDNTDEAFEEAMGVFEKKVNKSGVVKEARERRFYKKPNEIRNERKRQVKREIEKNKRKGKK